MIHFHCSGIITLPQIKQASDEIRELQQTGEGMVHVVVDVLEIEKVDVKVSDIKVLFSNINTSPKHGWVITITNSRLIRFLATLSTQFISARERQFETLEEGIRFITEADDRLPAHEVIIAKIESSKKSPS